MNRHALEQHLRNSSSHWWCRRCDEYFESLDDLDTHKAWSGAHWICRKCDIDFESETDRDDHLYRDPNHNLCVICKLDFNTPNNLSQVRHKPPRSTPNARDDNELSLQHKITHLPRTKPCASCGDKRVFATWSAMFIHLERGCNTTIGKLNQSARWCYQWKHYVRPEHAQHLLTGRSRSWPDAFQCPGCKRTFTYLSSLVQHAESESCEEGLADATGPIGKMIRFVTSRV